MIFQHSGQERRLDYRTLTPILVRCRARMRRRTMGLHVARFVAGALAVPVAARESPVGTLTAGQPLPGQVGGTLAALAWPLRVTEAPAGWPLRAPAAKLGYQRGLGSQSPAPRPGPARRAAKRS